MRGRGEARARAEVAALAREATEWVTMARGLGRALAHAVPVDHQCWHTLDPDTLVFTAAVAERLPPEPRLARHEYAIPDVNTWVSLARTGATVGILSRATGGRPETSARYRELLAPHGIAHELRASFVDGDGTCWGAVSLLRDRGRDDFSEEEAALVRSLARQIAEGYRRSFIVTQALRADEPEAPGLVILDAKGEVVSVTPAAQVWLEELADVSDVAATGPLPYAVLAVAERARLEASAQVAAPLARARARGRSGRWLLLYGTPLDTGRVGVIVERARPDEIAPIILRAYGLSPRERQVTLLCMRGLSTKEVAAALFISPHTVQDHLKSVFEKVGVRSRRELTARIFMEQYQPRFMPLALDEPWSGAEIPALRAGTAGVEDRLPS